MKRGKIERSKITWTDFSGGALNFVLRGRAPGDCECSPGCQNCYALPLRQRGGEKVPLETTYSWDKLESLRTARFTAGDTPYRRGPGSRPLCFACDMGDLFHPAVNDGFIYRALSVMQARADVDWQLLTKRAERMAGITHAWAHGGDLPENIWVGVTVENIEQSYVRLPHLLSTRSRIRFASIEPMLGPVESGYLRLLDWVICGGESGPNRRPFDSDWARSLRDQCVSAGVPFFYKQGSALHPGRDDELDGRTWKEFPRRPANS